jgi:hypothetical protein
VPCPELGVPSTNIGNVDRALHDGAALSGIGFGLAVWGAFLDLGKT